MSRHALVTAHLAMSLLLFRPGPSHAQDHKTQAIELFREASAAFERQEYAAAARAFEASYEHVHRAAAIYNAARSWDAAEDHARAADAYQIALERTDLGGAEAQAARKRLAELEEQLGILEASAPDGWKLSVARIENGAAPLELHLQPGAYVVRAQAPDGTHQERTVQVDARRTASVRFVSPPVARAQGAVAPRRDEARQKSSPPPDRTTSWQRPAAWVALGLAGIGTGTAIALGVDTLRARDEFYADPTSQPALDEAKALRLGTNIAWGAAAVFAVTGVVLMLTSSSGGPAATPRVARAPGSVSPVVALRP
jgi:hypothetical protein